MLHSRTVAHREVETAFGQRARGSATHKGHRRIASGIEVDPQAADVVCVHCQRPIEMRNRFWLTGIKTWVIVMSKTRIWRVVLAWSHVLELGELFPRGSSFWQERFRLKVFGQATTNRGDRTGSTSHLYRWRY